MWKLYGQNDSLLERFLGLVETCYIFPSDVRLLREDGACEGTTKLLGVGILFFALFIVPADDISIDGRW